MNKVFFTKEILETNGFAVNCYSYVGWFFCCMFILISCSLFIGAAYGQPENESSFMHPLDSEDIVRYPAGVRTSVIRMIIKGIRVEDLRFDRPEDFSIFQDRATGVFLREGGGVIFKNAPAHFMANGQMGTWFFNMALNIDGIGTDAAELVAYLPGVSEVVCRQQNAENGIDGIPLMNKALSPFYVQSMRELDLSASAPVLPMQKHPFACFQSGAGGPFVYYRTLIER